MMLVGVRDVRDYRIYSDEHKKEVLGGSAFNIKSESKRMARFSRDHISALVKQRESATGQRFNEKAIDALVDLTNGQPWCVNRLSYQAVIKNPRNVIDEEDIRAAAEDVILLRETHFDQLAAMLMNDRVRRVIEPMIIGADPVRAGANLDDLRYLEDLGLLKKALDTEHYTFSNKLYSEIIPRELVAGASQLKAIETIDRNSFFDVKKCTVKMMELMNSWVAFYLENFYAIRDAHNYKEDVFHIVFFAFLQRIINGGGRIRREFAINENAADVVIEIPHTEEGLQREVIELKTYRTSDTAGFPSVVKHAKEQLTKKYLAPMQLKSGYLIIWNQKATETKRKAGQLSAPPEHTTEVVNGKTVHSIILE